MVNKDEHPGTFKDSPEKRILHIEVKLRPEDYVKNGQDHKVLLDQAIHQTMLEKGYEATADSLSSHLRPDAPTYEARILGNGSEIYFHALGGACMVKVGQVGILGTSHLDASWRINAAQSMQRPIVPE